MLRIMEGGGVMADLSTWEAAKDTVLGLLSGLCLSLLALIRRQDLGEINRRLDHLERDVDELRGRTAEEGRASRKETT